MADKGHFGDRWVTTLQVLMCYSLAARHFTGVNGVLSGRISALWGDGNGKPLASHTADTF